MDDAPVLLCAARFLITALLQKGDEFRMNFEGLGTFFDIFVVFRTISASWG
jgi:hypothetical protein